MSAPEPTTPSAPNRAGWAWRPYALTLPALLLLVAVIGYPLLTIVLRSLSEPQWGVQNYAWFFGAPVNLTVLQRTFVISAWVTAVCVACAYPYAYLMTAVGPRVRLVLVLCVLIPFWVSGVVRTLSWVILLQDSGVINSLLRSAGFDGVRLIRTQTGVVIGMAQVLLPFMILPLYATLEKMDETLLEAAADLGCPPIQAFWKITFPISLPGVVAGCFLVFIPITGEFVIPGLLGGSGTKMIGKTLWYEFFNNRNWPLASAVAVVLLLILVVPIVLFQNAQKASEAK